MLRDIAKGVPQVVALRRVIDRAAADLLVLGGMDYDAGAVALRALNEGLARPYPHLRALMGNEGVPTGLDLDGDGRPGGPGDRQSFGRYAGQSGLALLSRLPIDSDVSLNLLLWRDVPDSRMVDARGRAGADARGADRLRLSSGGHWLLGLRLPSGRRLTVLAFHAGPPVFDGPEDRNGRRNADEIALWLALLDGRLAEPAPRPPFVLTGTANIDPEDGEGRHEALAALLSDPRFRDPAPRSVGGRLAATDPGRANPGQDTVDWPDPEPGNLRVDYVLPGADVGVTASGVLWPPPDDPFAETVEQASRHRLVWVDIRP